MFNLCLLVFAAIIPFENKLMAWFNFGGGFNITNVFLILLVFVWLIKRRNNMPFFIKNPLNLVILLFIFLTYISLWTGFFATGISAFGEPFHEYKRFITLFILFFLIVNNVSDKKNAMRIIYVMTFVILLIAYVDIKEFRGAGVFHFDDNVRIQLLGMNPNYLGALFAQFIPLFVTLFVMSKKLRNKIFYLICFLISLPALLFTYSRGAYLAIAVALLVIGILGGKKTFYSLFLLLVVAIFAQSIAFGYGRIIPPSIKERIEMIKGEKADQDISVQNRKEIWAITKEYISSSPIFGYGFGASHRVLPMDIHNMYLKFAFDSGLPTLLIFILFILTAFRISFKVYFNANDDFEKAVSLGFIGSLIAMVIGNFFGERFNRLAANGYFVILMSIVVRIYAEQNKLARFKRAVKVHSK